jgi:hypothetical protein
MVSAALTSGKYFTIGPLKLNAGYNSEVVDGRKISAGRKNPRTNHLSNVPQRMTDRNFAGVVI